MEKENIDKEILKLQEQLVLEERNEQELCQMIAQLEHILFVYRFRQKFEELITIKDMVIEIMGAYDKIQELKQHYQLLEDVKIKDQQELQKTQEDRENTKKHIYCHPFLLMNKLQSLDLTKTKLEQFVMTIHELQKSFTEKIVLLSSFVERNLWELASKMNVERVSLDDLKEMLASNKKKQDIELLQELDIILKDKRTFVRKNIAVTQSMISERKEKSSYLKHQNVTYTHMINYIIEKEYKKMDMTPTGIPLNPGQNRNKYRHLEELYQLPFDVVQTIYQKIEKRDDFHKTMS